MSARPLRSGVLILPVCVVEALMGIFVGVFIHRTGKYRSLMRIGTVLLTIGNGLYIHLNATPSVAEIVIFQLIAGAGAGMLFEPPLIALQALVSQDETATSTATFGFVRNIGTSSSIIIGGVIFQNGMSMQSKTLASAGLSPDLVKVFSGPEAAANVMLVETITDPGQAIAVKQAFAWSLRNMWIMYTCVSSLGILASMFVVKTSLSKEHQETKTGLKERTVAIINDTAI